VQWVKFSNMLPRTTTGWIYYWWVFIATFNDNTLPFCNRIRLMAASCGFTEVLQNAFVCRLALLSKANFNRLWSSEA
jgi:hypothetical protein